LAKISQGEHPFLVKPKSEKRRERQGKKGQHEDKSHQQESRSRNDLSRNRSHNDAGKQTPAKRDRHEGPRLSAPDRDMERFRIEVGNKHEVKPNNIVGAIANEAGVDSQYIKNVTINEDHTILDLPIGMPRDLFRELKKVWVAGQQLQISRLGEKRTESTKPKNRKEKKDKKPAKARKRKAVKIEKKKTPKPKPKQAG
jgi:ATP-dependent RNA helicase DeaD